MGLKLQKEEINDYISEWKLIDSAFFNFPHPNDNIGGDSDANQEIILNELLKTQINLVSYRNSGYIQIAKRHKKYFYKSWNKRKLLVF